MRSGHEESFRKLVMEKAVRKYEAEMRAHQAGEEDIYRSRERRREQIEQKGGRSDRENWFKQKSGAQKVTSVLKVPLTSRNKLKLEVEAVLKRYTAPEGVKTRVQESNGKKLRHTMMRTDPFPRTECGREKCPLSSGGEPCKERCFQGHVNYSVFCKRCDENVVNENRAGVNEEWSHERFQYIGESSRGCYTRFNQHAEEYKRCNNFMWQHVRDHHRGRKRSATEDFSMKREGTDSESTRRGAREGVRIRRVQDKEEGTMFKVSSEGGKTIEIPVSTTLMNSKEEFHQPKLVGVHLSQQ